jgi:hypothetical protein
MFYQLIYILILFIVQTTSEQYLLGTHFYVNQDNILIDNTLKTVSTLSRPYDLVAFIRQSERLARVDHLQTYIDAVDDVAESSSQQHQINNDKQDNNIDKCNDFIRDGESLVFKILKTNLYDTFHIPFQLKNLSNNYTINEKSKTKILTCNHFCQINTSKSNILFCNIYFDFYLKVYLHLIIYQVFQLDMMINKQFVLMMMK